MRVLADFERMHGLQRLSSLRILGCLRKVDLYELDQADKGEVPNEFADMDRSKEIAPKGLYTRSPFCVVDCFLPTNTWPILPGFHIYWPTSRGHYKDEPNRHQ